MSGGMGGGEGGVSEDLLTTKGDTHGFDTNNARVPIGVDTTVLTADSTTALGLAWTAPTDIAPPTTTKGDLSGFSTLQARIPIGADTTILTADSTQALGLAWAAAAGGSGFSFIVGGNQSSGSADRYQSFTGSTSSSAEAEINPVNNLATKITRMSVVTFINSTSSDSIYYGRTNGVNTAASLNVGTSTGSFDSGAISVNQATATRKTWLMSHGSAADVSSTTECTITNQ